MRRSLRTVMLLSLIVFTAALTLSGCGGSTPATPAAPAKPAAKDTLIIGADREPVTLDPSGTNVTLAQLIERQIYDTLLKLDKDLKVVPNLAESWKQLDDLTWQFNLRKGVKFHNGEELTSADVLFSFQRLYKLPPGSIAVTYIDPNGFKTPDKYTFILKTTTKYAFLETQLCDGYVNILNQKAVTAAADKYARNPIGTGPYKFVSWAAGDNITLTKFDDYWGDKAKIKNLKFRFITEQTARTINLETGDVDMVIGIPAADADRISKGKDTTLVMEGGGSVRYIAFNCQKPVFKDKRVRQAIAYAVDLETIRKVIYGDKTSEKGVTPVPPNFQGRNTDLKPYTQDLAKAKALMAEAGVKSLTVNYNYLASSSADMLAQMLQEMLKPLNITMKIQPMESGALSTMLNKGEHEFTVSGTNMDSFEAGKGLYEFFHSKSNGSTKNRSYLSNKNVDALLDKVVVETNTEARNKLIYQAQQMIYDETPVVVICYEYRLVGLRKNVQGFVPTPTGNYELHKFTFTN
jgi:peptide/nickel transport system substrate-binding protein